jgi:diguanylate cyclase (GGDEF)-like protein
MHARPASLLLWAVLCLAPAPGFAAAAGSPAFEAMLRQAEQVRSSDAEQFSSLLGQLNASVAAASPRQREQLGYLKAYELAYTGRFDLGIEAAKKLFEEATDVRIRFRAGSLIVNGYAATREFTEGLRYLEQTLLLADQIDDPELRHHGWSAAGVMYNQVGQHELGERFANLMLADGPSPRTRCFAGSMRLESLYHLGRLDDNDVAMAALVQECVAIGERVVANFTRVQMARVLADRGRSGDAIALLGAHLEEIERTRYPRLIGEVHSLLAELNLAQGYSTEAEHHALRSLDQRAGLIQALPLVAAHRVLYETARARGDTAAALEHHVRYMAADRAYLDGVKARELAFQMVRHESLQQDKTIELLNRENQVLTLEQQVASKTVQATRLLILLLAVLLAFIAYWAFRTKRTQLVLRKLAQTDALTGIDNRHHFTRRAEAVLEACRRSGGSAGLVMMDLDSFKSINDRFGHAAGDWALREVAKACLPVCRPQDLLGRLGGEEFAFLLVDRDLGTSTSIARKCRELIAAIDSTPSGHDFRITASFGVAGTSASGYSLDALLAQADDALYRSKREGRDRVSVQSLMIDPEATTGRPA